jgi:hypothetical protein
MPSDDYTYVLCSILDESENDDLLLIVNTDGSIKIKLQTISGQEIASSDSGIIISGVYNHIEFASKANQLETESSTSKFFEEDFSNGLSSYAFSPSSAEGNQFNIVSDLLYGGRCRRGGMLRCWFGPR